MNRPRHILVATDFSECGKRAEATAVALARRWEAGLHWLHVVETPMPLFEPLAVALPDGLAAEARDAAQARLDEAAQAGFDAGLRGTARLAEMPAAQAIARRGLEVDADLIVVGTHGYSGAKRWVLGSVAESVVRHASCSVLTAKPGFDPDSVGTILVGTDFSEPAEGAVAAAAELARDLGAPLRIVHAMPISGTFATPYDIALPADALVLVRQAADERVAAVANACPDGVKVTTAVSNDPAAVALVAEAEQCDASLVVTGSHGRSGIRHALMGSVAERTLRHAPCSVLTIRTAASTS
jgi:nucleotide-binding universal stress UspA family protein